MSSKMCFDHGWGCWNLSILERELPYIAELGEYLKEKAFYSLDTSLSDDLDTGSCISIPNITPQFGDAIIVPWILRWHAQYRSGSVKAPIVRYDLEKTEMHLTIVFSPSEIEVVKQHTVQQRELDEHAAREGWKDYF